MTFPDKIGQSSKLFPSFSMDNNLNKKDQHRKLKRLNTSLLNIFPQHRQTKNFKKENINEQLQQTNSFLHPQSIITTSELSRSISNKSITFASVFDELGDNNNTNHTPFDFGASIENEDLVIVVPNKYVNNEPIIEPYPFRSEISPEFHSSINITNTSDSKKKSFHHLFHSHRPKKLHHPIKTIQLNNSIDRSKSAPNLVSFSLSSIPPPTSIKKDQHQPLKTVRQWFKSSSFGRFIQSFTKHSKNHKQKSRIKPTISSRKYSDLIY